MNNDRRSKIGGATRFKDTADVLVLSVRCLYTYAQTYGYYDIPESSIIKIRKITGGFNWMDCKLLDGSVVSYTDAQLKGIVNPKEITFDESNPCVSIRVNMLNNSYSSSDFELWSNAIDAVPAT